MCCLPEVIGVNPEEKPPYPPRRVADALVDAVIRAHSGQRVAVIVWEQPLERGRACPDAVKLAVRGEQLDSYAPERSTISDYPHAAQLRCSARATMIPSGPRT